MNRPWMPLYVGDYLGDTGHLTTAQHGAYLLLMMHYWRKGELPDDDRQLSKITKLPLKTWCDYRATLQDFFHEGWKHKRIDAELDQDDAGFREARDRRPEGRPRLGAGAHEAGKCLALGTVLAASNCWAMISPAAASADHSHSHSHQSLLKAEAIEGEPEAIDPAKPSQRREPKPRSPSARNLRPMSPSEAS